MKKIVSITLMLAMILALSVSAFAETPASQNMEVSYVVDSHYVIVIPDGGNDLIVDPDTGVGDMDIGVKPESVIPGDKALQMSVNAGRHYDDTAKTYRLMNGTGGQLLNYVLSYKGNEVNPGVSGNMVVLETADSDAVFAGFQNRVSVTVGTARTAGRYTDTLTFRFALV
ncbi:MAG: hypothetical protein J6J19_06145 [Oscillospiraceae bacterium]|nr:hypothetical protein [Oscillospiraceae bacterium]